MRRTIYQAGRNGTLVIAALVAVSIPASAVAAPDAQRCPCNVGLPAALSSDADTGTTIPAPTDAASVAQDEQSARTRTADANRAVLPVSDGFDYNDAAVGAATALGAGLALLIATTSTRRRRKVMSSAP